jgi:hypothetical protein
MDKKKPVKDQTAEDLEKMLLLFRHWGAFDEAQQEFIWQMLRKYVDRNYPKPIPNCDCPMSFGAAITKLRDHVSQNKLVPL